MIGAAHGKTLSHSPQNVPGGLLDFVNCTEIGNVVERLACKLVFENGTTGVNATAELAGPAKPIELFLGNLFEEKGTAFTLPVKLHLENPLLGSSCYIGSESSPIEIPLTTGTTSPQPSNKPISGKLGPLRSPKKARSTRSAASRSSTTASRRRSKRLRRRTVLMAAGPDHRRQTRDPSIPRGSNFGVDRPEVPGPAWLNRTAGAAVVEGSWSEVRRG